MECPGLILYPRTTCNSHGICNGTGTREGDGKCICDDKYQGVICDHCINFHFGTECEECPGMVLVNETFMMPCYNHGHCEEDTTGKGRCLVCDKGFDPDTNCLECSSAYYYSAEDDICLACDGITLINRTWVSCYGNGICDINNNGKCICNDGFDINTQCKECLPGRYSDQCLKCPGLIENETISCDGHGICNDDGEYDIYFIIICFYTYINI